MAYLLWEWRAEWKKTKPSRMRLEGSVPLGSRGVGPEGRDEVRQGVGSLSKNRNNFSYLRLACRRRVIEKRATQVLLFMLMRSVR